jgi:periplasmic copper chaperone A
MRLRSTFIAAASALAVLGVAAPASAHEEINPKTIPTGQSAFLTLTAANESSADLVRIVLRAPAGIGFGEATRSPAGWSATATENTITWTGTLKPHTFETWGFESEGPDQPGTLTYTVTLGFAGGRTDEHEVEIAAAAQGGGAGAGAPPATTVTTAAATPTPASPTTVAAAPAGSGGDSGGDSGMATAALVLSIVALVLAAGALIAARRGGGWPSPTPASGAGAAGGAAQDW